MDVKNCRQCGRLYNYIGGSYRNLCPDCISSLEDKFQNVKDYIEEHKNATMQMISEDCEVSVKQIEQWVREERLTFAEDSPIGITCECCGTMIKTGRYCENCKVSMTQKFSSMYRSQSPQTNQNNRRDNGDTKMRFLNT